MNTLFTLIRSLFYATCFIGFFGWLANSLRIYDLYFGLFPEGVRIPGLIIMVIGLIFALSCVLTFVFRGKGTPALFDPPREFVPLGPYRYCRNPMYIGGLTALFGFGLFHRSISILIFFLFLLFFMHLFVIFIEEPGLKKRFGESYENYLCTVNRWLPKF